MKTQLTAAIASILVASLSATAFAQGAQQTTPSQQTPQQQMPQQQMSQQQMPPTTSTPMRTTGQMGRQGTMSSAKIKREIKSALTQHGITATNVTVTFQGGTATLRGTVVTRQDIAKAKKVAMHVQGVSRVDVSGLHARKG